MSGPRPDDGPMAPSPHTTRTPAGIFTGRRLLVLLSVALIAASCTSTDTTADPDASAIAELILENGRVYTVNPDQPWAEAVAVADGRIIFVGDTAGAADHAGPETERVDLDGRMVLPGLHDVHTHPAAIGADPRQSFCSFTEEMTPPDMAEIIASCAPSQPEEWVAGGGMSIWSFLASGVEPLGFLDQHLPDRPAVFLDISGHAVIANSAAFEQAGIDLSTPDPPGGAYLRDPESGELIGVALDTAADTLNAMAAPPSSDTAKDLAYENLQYILNEFAAAGLTSIVDARTFWQRGDHEAWIRAEADGLLPMRSILALWGYPQADDEQQLAELAALYRDDPESLLRFSQVKLYSDGLISNTTAALLDPYLVDLDIGTNGNRGLNYFTEERIARYVTELQDVGFDLFIHAIGDRGVHESLNAIETAALSAEGADHRHRLTHLDLVDPADRPRFAELGVIADFQTAGEFTLPDNWERDAGPFIGDRAADQFPMRDILDAGAVVTLSSDWDVSDFNPFVGLEHAVQMGERGLSLEEAIEAYTISAAYLMRQETITGSIEPGKAADLVVIDQNLFDVPTADIDNTTVLLTLLAGSATHRDPSFTDFGS